KLENSCSEATMVTYTKIVCYLEHLDLAIIKPEVLLASVWQYEFPGKIKFMIDDFIEMYKDLRPDFDPVSVDIQESVDIQKLADIQKHADIQEPTGIQQKKKKKHFNKNTTLSSEALNDKNSNGCNYDYITNKHDYNYITNEQDNDYVTNEYDNDHVTNEHNDNHVTNEHNNDYEDSNIPKNGLSINQAIKPNLKDL
ncbi:24997_t:CDS:2, partial [Cetraspora pellucida]